VQIRDASGNAVAQSGIVVTASIASGGGTLGGRLSATTNSNGIATFSSLSLTGTAGARTLSFSADNLTSATSNSIALAAGPATQLVISTQPSATVNSGAVLAQQPVVQLRDAGDNIIGQSGVVVTVSASGATLGGTATATTNASGNAVFSGLTLMSPGGSATLTFSATGLTSASSPVLVVVQGSSAPTNITITRQPSATATSGVAFDRQPAIQLRDASNAAVAQANVTVTASLATAGGTLSGTKSVTTDANGVATFTNLSISGTTGARTLSFTVNGLPSVTSSAIAVSAGTASKLTITTQPSASAQNTVAFPQQPVVQLRDASDNAVAQANVTVTASIGTGTTGTLSGATAKTDANGVATFSGLALTGQTGARTFTFSATGVTSVTSSNVSISAGPAAKLAMSTQPSSSAMSGAAFATQPKVQLRDVSNNTVSQSGVAVTVGVNSGTGTLGGTKTVTTNSSGIASFSGLSITGSGTHVLVFTSPNLSPMTSSAISVTGSATQLAITTQPSGTATSGSALSRQPVVQLRDGSGATVATSGIAVTAAIATGGGTLSGTLTATTDASGAASFSGLMISGAAGDRTLVFSATGLTSATSNTISVTTGTGSVGSTTEPRPTGTIVLDTRAGGAQDIQAVSTFAGAQAYWKASGGVLNPGSGSGVMGFTTDYNGSGKHAFRIDWQANPGGESAINDNSFYFPSTLSSLYCSVVIHLGRTATGGGVGNIGSFVPVTSSGGMKRILWLRQRDNGTDRLYWNWPTAGQNSQQNDLTIDNRNFDTYFNANYGVGVDVRWTFELIPGNPGTLRVWRDGVLVKENTNAAIGTTGFAQLQFITTRFAAQQAETEYWTDLVVWKP
jgi:adhesin/invasin